MFRDLPACSGMFRVPGFIDAQGVNDVVFILILAKYSSAEFCIQILYFSKLKCRISALSVCC